jgi:ubiquitin
MGEMKKKILNQDQEITWECKKCGEMRTNKSKHEHGKSIA